MGDRFLLNLACSYCGKMGTGVYYAPTCDVYDFVCKDCKRHNFVSADFTVKAVEDVTLEDVVSAFEMASNSYHSQASVKRAAAGYLRGLKRHGRAEAGR